jgi:UDPglucose 6-dehydrogenase
LKVGFIGLGKLGLPCAAAISVENNIEVVGFDVDRRVRGYINDSKVPYVEKDLDHYLKLANINFKNSVSEVVEESNLVFLAIQTPHEAQYEGICPTPDTRKDFDYSFLIDVVTEIAKVLGSIEKKVTIVVISTVLPGTMRTHVLPILSSVRDKVNFCYNPFFIAMGQTIQDFLNPEFILIGSDSSEESKDLIEFYKEFQNAPIQQMQIESAELTKVAYNTFIGFKIVFANTLGEICETLGSGNVDQVTGALAIATDRLVSGKYLKAGMGDGGGCHPRDQIAMSYLAQKLNLSTDPFTWLANSRDAQTLRQAEMIRDVVFESGIGAVVVMGESYKANINLTVGSPSVLLQYYLQELGVKFSVFDPFTKPNSSYADEKGVFFIATNHQYFKEVIFPNDSIVIDPWGDVCDRAKQDSSVEVITLGR